MNWKKTVSSSLFCINRLSHEIDTAGLQPTTLQDLPDDMLLEIFSYLSADYFKTTSLVCRRWNNVTFGSNSVQLNVTVLNRDHSMEKSYRQLLSVSKRPYKNLKLVDCQLALLTNVLPKFSSNLNSLTLSCNIKLKHLPKIFKYCSNLSTLDIKFSHFDRTSEKLAILHPLPNLQNLKVDNSFLHLPDVNLHQLFPNLTSLTILFSEDLPVPESVLNYFCPRLRELDLQINFPHESGSKVHHIWSAKFPLLKRFSCYLERIDKTTQSYDPASNVERFLDQTWNLKTIKLYRVLYNRWNYLDFWNQNGEDLLGIPQSLIFAQLSRSCSNLGEVSLGMLKLREEQFLQLCQLPHLRELHIDECTIHTPRSDCCQVVDSLKELSLQSVEIDAIAIFNDFVRQTFPNLRKLSVHNCKNLFEVAEHNFSRLESLEHLSVRQIVSLPNISFFNDYKDSTTSKLPLSWDYLLNLATFPVLQTVSIFCDRIADYSFPDQPNLGVISGSIRTLAAMAKLTDEILLRLAEFFPNLTTLKLRRNERCTPEGIQRARELLPDCCFELA